MNNSEVAIMMPYHPAESRGHLKAYNQASLMIVFVAGIFNIASAYFIEIFEGGAIYSALASAISSVSAAAQGRIIELDSVGRSSAALYVASIFLFAPVTAITTYILFRIYEAEILIYGVLRRFHLGYIFGILAITVFISCTFYFSFFYDLNIAGSDAVTVWVFMVNPAFGFFSAALSVLVSIGIMNYIAAIIKICANGGWK